jgi:hypothetical protein
MAVIEMLLMKEKKGVVWKQGNTRFALEDF